MTHVSMKICFPAIKAGLCALALCAGLTVHAQSPVQITTITMAPVLSIDTNITQVGFTNDVRYFDSTNPNLSDMTNWSNWTPLTNLLVTQLPYQVFDMQLASPPVWSPATSNVPERYYALVGGAYLPTLSAFPANVTISELGSWTTNLTIADAYQQTNNLAFRGLAGPTNLVVFPNGQMRWYPGEGAGSNQYTIVVGVTNTAQNVGSTMSFNLTVNEVYITPVLTVPASATITAGQTYSGSAYASGPSDSPSMVFSKEGGPAALTVNSTSGLITWPTTVADAGSWPVTIKVTGEGGLSATATFTLTVSSSHPNMALIPAGEFQMGDANGDIDTISAPQHRVTVSQFLIDKTLVTYQSWRDVYLWAKDHGYEFEPKSGVGKAADHPVTAVSWYDVVKWCNARSEKEGLLPSYYTNANLSTSAVYRKGRVDLNNSYVKWEATGYRLPTEAQWEKAARGGVSGQRFPWGNTISWSQANYQANTRVLAPKYDVAKVAGVNPKFNDGYRPLTSPVGFFQENGYGLYDMSGDAAEWCWDWYQAKYYRSESEPVNNPRGPAIKNNTVRYRVLRGGAWSRSASEARCANRAYATPLFTLQYFGFRCVQNP